MEKLLPFILIFVFFVIVVGWLIRGVDKKRPSQLEIQNDHSQLPFPRHISYPEHVLKPDHISQEELDTAMRKAYGEWLALFMLADYTPGRAFLRMGVDRRFLRYTVEATSVGQGYAMLISALMGGDDLGAQGRFDRLLTFCDAHPSSGQPNFMSWQVHPDLTVNKPMPSNTQGDMLIAYALLMADKQWGSKGDYNYHSIALKIIQALKAECVHPQQQHLLSGNDVNGQDPERWLSPPTVNAAAMVLNSFAKVSYDASWLAVKTKMLDLLEKVDNLPGAVINTENPQDAGNYDAFEAEAAPLLLHLALASILSEDDKAQGLLLRMAGKLKAASPTADFVSTYSLDGKPQSKESSLSMLSGMAAAAMLMDDQDWLNLLWDKLMSAKVDRMDPAGSTLRLMSLLLLSGNWMVI